MAVRWLLAAWAVMLSLGLWNIPALVADPSVPSGVNYSADHWLDDYHAARERAEQTGRMLLVWLRDGVASQLDLQIENSLACDAKIQELLENFVVVRLELDDVILTLDNGTPTRLVDHPAFAEMHGGEGLAVVDLADRQRPTYGHVVSAFPFKSGKYYRFGVEDLAVLLGLPAGTLTERTMVWAVRTHPERPRSTLGEHHPVLARHVLQHSLNQADIRLQGHHRWEQRFHQIRSEMGGAVTPVEVVAESWPNQTMIDSCVDCVASWRHSSGHWRAVNAPHAYYAYDIQRGNNSIWYATGIFAGSAD